MEKRHISEFEYDRHEIERALFFLSNALQESGNNAKPVLLHSIQVAQMIWERDFSENTVIAAILHDIVEDTDITVADVEREFGQQVARYVESLTIPDYQDVKQSFARAAQLGSDVLAIRAADLIQNSYYYSLASVDIQKELRSKYEYFMGLSDEALEKSLADELQKTYDQNVKTLPA